MLAPRVALLTYNEKDNCCFAAPHALPPLLGGRPARLSASRPGRRTCTSTSTTIRARTTSSATTARRSTRSSASTGSRRRESYLAGRNRLARPKCKTAEQLSVELPEDNLDLQQLAEQADARIAADADCPIVQPSRRRCRAAGHAAASVDTGQAGRIVPSAATHSHPLEAADRRRSGPFPRSSLPRPRAATRRSCWPTAAETAAAERIAELLAAGQRVVAVDPFYFGESKIKKQGLSVRLARFVASASGRWAYRPASSARSPADLNSRQADKPRRCSGHRPADEPDRPGCCRQRRAGDRRRDAARLAAAR